MKPLVTWNRIAAATRIACTGMLCWILTSACGGPVSGPEEQLQHWVREGQAAVEAKERRELVRMISPAYKDSRGNDVGDIENMLRAYFFRQHSIKLLTSIEEIRMYGDSAAEIDLMVGMAGTNEGVLGFSADAYRFRLELENKDDDWQLISARWGEPGEDLR
jgi:hypothetical protein